MSSRGLASGVVSVATVRTSSPIFPRIAPAINASYECKFGYV